MTNTSAQLDKVKTRPGFIAALDQSGGSTPKALALYGVGEDQYQGEDEMFATMHAMRSRIVTSASFNGDRILGAILFEGTMEREVDGKPSASYLWENKQVVPFLKVDKGLADESGGVQLMKPMPGLDGLLGRARDAGIFGTKMRSVINQANADGVSAIVDQQFEVAHQIIAAGLVPIIEPEVNIKSTDKAASEALLRSALMAHIEKLGSGQNIMLKLTLPEQADFYSSCIAHPNVVRVVALSGGYSREEANRRLAQNHGMVASFSRALTEGLAAQQSQAEFDSTLDTTIESIYQASNT